MSVSLYRNQVDRLTKEIAGLEGKVADERSRATKERGEALRITNSISPSTSDSMVRSKLRDIQRREERASQHEKKAAQLADQIASKRRSLSSAESQLEQALKRDREKDQRESRRRREEELRHLRELERARRTSVETFPPLLAARPRRAAIGDPADTPDYEYDVCLSFAGEDRPYVEMVARELKEHGVRVFYDLDETPKLWGKDLAAHLDYIYRQASRFCVMFISEAYAQKAWTRHERRSALARAIQEEHEYVLPARFDDTDLPGLQPTLAYVDLREYAPTTIAEFLLEKLGFKDRPA